MAYYIDDENVSIDDLMKRIEETDLVPSRELLRDGIKLKFGALEQQGIATLARLRKELKNPKRIEAISQLTSIDVEYLTLLKREIEGYFPKPLALKSFVWLPEEEIAKLEDCGINDTAALYLAASSDNARTELVESTGVDVKVLEALVQLAGLTRVQWVSPTVARMLVEASYNNTTKLAVANAEHLCEAFLRVNAGNRLFKGKIGLRDVKRLIKAANFVPD